jgi:hypothetical protein
MKMVTSKCNRLHLEGEVQEGEAIQREMMAITDHTKIKLKPIKAKLNQEEMSRLRGLMNSLMKEPMSLTTTDVNQGVVIAVAEVKTVLLTPIKP